MVDRQLTSISIDIDPKGPPGPLGSKNVSIQSSSPRKLTELENSSLLTEKISHKNGDKELICRQVSLKTSASKAKKAKVAMMKKFVTNIGTTSKIIESSARKNEG